MNLVKQDGRVPPGVPGQPMTNFGNLAPSPIDRWGSKLTLSGSDSASPPVAYSPNSRNSPTVCPGTPGGTLAIENYSRNPHIRILQRTAREILLQRTGLGMLPDKRRFADLHGPSDELPGGRRHAAAILDRAFRPPG